MLNSSEHEISKALKNKLLKSKYFIAFKLSDVVFTVLMNVKMSLCVYGILTLMSSSVELSF